MPNVDAGTGQSGDRTSGEMRVSYVGIAPDVIEGREGRPPAVKVLFKSVTSDATASLAVPIGDPEEAKARLKPFTKGEPGEFTEQALRRFVESAHDGGPWWVRTWGDYIQAFMAGVGEHVGTLADLRLTKKGDRVWFTLRSLDGFESDFSAPWPPIECRKGEEPHQDFIGGVDDKGKKAFSPNKGPFPYLLKLGFDWEKFALEGGELETAPALWPGHFEDDGIPMLPYLEIGKYPPDHDAWCYFSSMTDLTPELMDATRRHGLKQVAWEVVMDEKWGLSVKRGDYFFELTKVKVLGGEATAGLSREEKEFEAEVEIFRELYDNLTKIVMSRSDVRFLTGDALTSEGRRVAKSVLVPAVRAYPDSVLARKEDGTPGTEIPPTMASWTLDGLVCANLTAERLINSGLDLVALDGIMNDKDPGKMLEWITANVPEWAGAGKDDGGELL